MNFTSGITFVGNARDPDIVYYNATLVNNNTAEGTQDDPVVVFKETKDSAILSDTSQYEMAVRKVTMSGPQKILPVLIPQIEIVTNTDASGVSYTTIPNVNKTVYSVTFGLLYSNTPTGTANRAYVYSEPVTWITENPNSEVPTPQTLAPVPVGNTQNIPQANQKISDYYYCYTYNHWLVCLNAALQKAWTTTTNAAIADLSGVGITATTIPRLPAFEYDEVTRLFSIYTDTKNSVTPQDISGSFTQLSFVGYNTNLEGLMTNFDTQYYGPGQLINSILPVTHPSPVISGPFVPQGLSDVDYPENMMTIRNKTGTNIQLSIDPATGVGYSVAPSKADVAYISFVTTQDFPSTGSLWSPISDFVITTSSIPIRNEFVTAPNRPGGGNLGVLPAQQTAFQAVLADFEIKHGELSHDFRGYIKYEPNLHKMVKLAPSKDELKTIDLFVYWKNRLTNELVPLRIYNLGSITIQLMFRRIGQDA